MPDIAVPFTLTTPGGTITFNDGTPDQFYIQEVQGLVQPPVRAPIDQVPYGDGGIGHNFWKDGRHTIWDGLFLITSVGPCDAQMAIRNQMEEDLRVALESIAALIADTGTLVWTPRGMTERTLVVRCDVNLDCIEEQDFAVRNFHFGLFSALPDWSEN